MYKTEEIYILFIDHILVHKLKSKLINLKKFEKKLNRIFA